MPEYLAPGVFVEEVSYRAKSIEGVSTTTTGFVGPTRYGPLEGEPEVATSLTEYEQSYGDGQPLTWDGDAVPNHMWLATRAFFEQGGKRLYVRRVWRQDADTGVAGADLPSDPGTGDPLALVARFPGAAGNVRVTLGPQIGKSTLTRATGVTSANGLKNSDVVLLTQGGAHKLAEAIHNQDGTWSFRASDATTTKLADLDPAQNDALQIFGGTVDIGPASPGGPAFSLAGLALHPDANRPSLPRVLDREKGDAPVSLVVKANPAQNPAWDDLVPALQGGMHGLRVERARGAFLQARDAQVRAGDKFVTPATDADDAATNAATDATDAADWASTDAAAAVSTAQTALTDANDDVTEQIGKISDAQTAYDEAD